MNAYTPRTDEMHFVLSQVLGAPAQLQALPAFGEADPDLMQQVLVEQNARAALAVADQGYVLEMGEIGLHGPAAELAQDPRVIDTYLGAAKK